MLRTRIVLRISAFTRYCQCLLLILSIFQAANTFAAAISVTRGPYLQQGSTTAMVVRWRTDVATDSFVRYGTAPGNFTAIAGDSALVTEHIVTIANLQPDTKYYYQIGTSNEAFPGDDGDFFVTSPPVGTDKPTRVWVLGDSGTADTSAAAVRNAYSTYGGTRPTDVWLMLGDNAYDSGSDSEYQDAVFDMYPTFLRNTVLWPTIGNHDAPAPYKQMFTLPQNAEAGGTPSGTEHYYSFDYANIHFVCLDSSDSDNSTNAPMCNWLRADLEATTQDWIIAYWHHPPYSKGSHDSDSESDLYRMRQNVLPILETYGVDLVLCGHSHSYERSYLLDGHYGNSSTLTQSMKKDGGDGRVNGTGAYRKSGGTPGRQGAVYTVAGSSGKTSSGDFDHPAMFYSVRELGSVVIDVTGNRLDLVFLQTNSLAGDYFTIMKGPPPTNTPAAPSGLAATAVSSSRINLSWVDNASDEEGFKVERSTNGVDFVQIAVVGATVTNGADIGLSPSRTYYYRVRAFNDAGHSLYSNHAQATTDAAPAGDTTAPGPVTNLLVSTITSNSARLTWTAPGDDGYSGTAFRYDIRYSRSAITDGNWASASTVSGEPTPSVAGASQGFTVNGLAAGVTFYFALRTSDETNNISPLSNVPSATTTPSGPVDNIAPAAIIDLSVVSTTTNSVTLAWTAAGDDGNAGTATAYDVRYSTAPITEGNWTSATQASGEPLPATPGTRQSFSPASLTTGVTYYFAVKVSDESGNSSPLSNGASATPTLMVAAGAVLIPSNSVWKYLDNGSNQGQEWRGRAFDDSSWASGPAKLGYGLGDEATVVRYGPSSSAKYITTYFRTSINIPEPGLYTNLLVQVMRDDGAVVYINDVEVYRGNMPGGSITHLTPAASDVTGSGSYRYYPRNVAPAVLVPGVNVVAVELHQASPSDPDLSFNFQLTGYQTADPIPRLRIERQAADIVISWPVTPASYVLEESASANPPNSWTAVATASTVVNGRRQVVVRADSASRFYRLRRP